MKYWWVTDVSLTTHVWLALYKSGYFFKSCRYCPAAKGYTSHQHEPPEERCPSIPAPEPEWSAAARSWDVGQEKEKKEKRTSKKHMGERVDL